MPDTGWTPERVDILRARFKAGDSIGLIVQALAVTGANFSREAVKGKRIRLGMRRMPAQLEAIYRANQKRSLGDNSAVPNLPRAKMPPVRAPGPKSGDLIAIGRGCRFPVGEATGADQLFCGEPKFPEKSYCPACCAIAYRPAKVIEA